jgi:hypothetical protein
MADFAMLVSSGFQDRGDGTWRKPTTSPMSAPKSMSLLRDEVDPILTVHGLWWIEG